MGVGVPPRTDSGTSKRSHSSWARPLRVFDVTSPHTPAEDAAQRADPDASPLMVVDDAVNYESLDLTVEELGDASAAEPEVEPVSYSGTDFDAEGLVRRLHRGDIVVPTFGHGDESLELAGFQRGFVWRRPQMDRFLESLLLGFPIPGIMLVQQSDKRYLVLDGQQRLKTLAAFYEGVHAGKEFALENVALQYKGLTYKSLSVEQRRTLDNTFIQATIVKSDNSRQSLDSIYQIFERLNSGGTQLTAHEIRIALYSGPFVDFLAELNASPGWRHIYGPPSPRLRDQELVLRILAFYLRVDEYTPPLKRFLNDFLGSHRDLAQFPTEEIRRLFRSATDALADADARSALRRSGQRINAALVEAVVVAAMRRSAQGLDMTEGLLQPRLVEVVSDSSLISASSAGTTNEDNVRVRMRKASSIFGR